MHYLILKTLVNLRNTLLRGTGNVVDACYILYLFKALYYSVIF